jgi:UDP-glucose 4-epimerase
VYGGTANADLTEDLPARPSTLYGVTKLASEQMVEMFRKGCGLPAVSARVTSVFGSSEQASPGRRNLSFMHHCMDSAFHKRLVTVADPFIMHDWIYAEDVAGGVAALLGAERLPSPVYNLCSGDPVSAEAVLQVFESEAPGFEWRIVPPEQANAAYPSGRRRPSPALLATEVGFQCRYDIRAGVRHYLEECRRLYAAEEA